eukprot:SAG11_NODE_29629_length_309_cov_0.652381_1_plen_80_part_01
MKLVVESSKLFFYIDLPSFLTDTFLTQNLCMAAPDPPNTQIYAGPHPIHPILKINKNLKTGLPTLYYQYLPNPPDTKKKK